MDIEELDTSYEIIKRERYLNTKVLDRWDMKEVIYTNHTGQIPVKTRNMNRYILMMVAIESNAVAVAPIKNISDNELRPA